MDKLSNNQEVLIGLEEHVLQSISKMRRFRSRNPMQYRKIIKTCIEKIEENPDASKAQIVNEVQRELKAAIFAPILVGVVIKVAIEIIYKWLKDNGYLDFSKPEEIQINKESLKELKDFDKEE